MSSLWFDCKVRGEKVGHAIYHNTSDLWFHEIVREDRHDRIGLFGCEQPMVEPPRVQLVDPHVPVWADITNDNYPDETYRLMYCELCRCLVPPPVDESGWYLDYPDEWLALVEAQAGRAADIIGDVED